MRIIEKYPSYFACEDGRIFSSKSGKYLKPSYDNQGYARIGIYVGNYKAKTIKIHRLIAETFIPNPTNKCDVNHINGIKSDNSVNNLEWCTRSENCLHAFRTGLSKISESHKKTLSINSKKHTLGNNPSARKVINIKTNEIFNTVLEAALSINMKRTTLIAMLTNQNPNKTNFKYYE